MKEASKAFSTNAKVSEAATQKHINPVYYVTEGLMFIEPYIDTLRATCKQRWIGMSVLDVYRKEFQEFPPSYYELAVEKGAIRVNGKQIVPTFKLHTSNIITHCVHMHEPPTIAEELRIVHEDDDILVVDKPASLPVHPTGRYRYNTLIERLKIERGWKFLGPCNRIDIPTSGIVLLGKTPEASRRIAAEMLAGNIQKTYFARVAGNFPDTPNLVCEAPLTTAGFKRCTQAIADHADAVASSKECKTLFNRLFYDALTDTSVVECKPVTGRAHQIRVHLQHLGHPIHNDSLYNNALWQCKRSEMPGASAYEVAKAVAPHLATIEGHAFEAAILPKQTDASFDCVDFAELHTDDGQAVICWKCNLDVEIATLKRNLPRIDLHSFSYVIPNLGYTFQTFIPSWARQNDPVLSENEIQK